MSASNKLNKTFARLDGKERNMRTHVKVKVPTEHGVIEITISQHSYGPDEKETISGLELRTPGTLFPVKVSLTR